MNQALRLAAQGGAKVSPNPQVGAIIVKDGSVIARGYHKRFGKAHAEVEAINHCRDRGCDPAGGTMFVTLEPCCHQGKTPPCTTAIAQAKIACVEIATLDDCHLVAGQGAKWLGEQGIEVNVGCCQRESRYLNAGYFKLQKSQKPLVILKWAQSLDGRLTWPSHKQQRWITGEKARGHVHKIRSRCGAVLVGIGTVLADDPLLTARMKKRCPQPRRVVLDSQLRIPLDCQLAQSADDATVLIYTLAQSIAGDNQADKMRQLDDLGCQVIPVDPCQGQVDISAVLIDLGKRGVTDLLVEGGYEILSRFMQLDLADRIMAYIAPSIIGGDKKIPTIDFSSLSGKLKNVTIESFDQDVLIVGDLPGLDTA